MTSKVGVHVVEGILYMVSPGLADAVLRDASGKYISAALKQNMSYKILFVTTLGTGRVPAQGQIAMQLVLEAMRSQNCF